MPRSHSRLRGHGLSPDACQVMAIAPRRRPGDGSPNSRWRIRGGPDNRQRLEPSRRLVIILRLGPRWMVAHEAAISARRVASSTGDWTTLRPGTAPISPKSRYPRTAKWGIRPDETHAAATEARRAASDMAKFMDVHDGLSA